MQGLSPIEKLISGLGVAPEAAPGYVHIATALLAFIIITVASVFVWIRLRKTEHCIIPSEKPSVANFFEITVSSLVALLEDTIGPGARKHLPLIGSLFIYILVCNMLSVIPTLKPPTENINTNLACAVIVFVYYNFFGIREQGIKNYISHMGGPVIWIAPLVFCIEMISHVIRPVSLSVRLFGNMTGDHTVLMLFSEITPVIIPIIFMLLSIFVAFIQAFVFTLLSIIYISFASKATDEGY